MKRKKIIKLILFMFIIMFGISRVVYADTLRCTDLGELKTDINNIFNLLKIVLPLLVIGLSSFDFIKAVTGKDNKDLKKAFNRFIKRLILAVVFFFLPVLIELLLNIFWINGTTCIN